MEAKPQLISLGTVQKCLSDPQFYKAMPEFLPLRTKFSSIVNQKMTKTGCSNCSKRRLQHRIGSDFIRNVASLQPEAVDRLKGYLGVSKIIINGMNPVTKKYESKII